MEKKIKVFSGSSESVMSDWFKKTTISNILFVSTCCSAHGLVVTTIIYN